MFFRRWPDKLKEALNKYFLFNVAKCKTTTIQSSVQYIDIDMRRKSDKALFNAFDEAGFVFLEKPKKLYIKLSNGGYIFYFDVSSLDLVKLGS